MKYVILILTVLSLTSMSSCSTNFNKPTKLSDEAILETLDLSVALIEGRTIYINPGTKQAELFSVLVAIDSSKPSMIALTSEGAAKQKEELFEYEQIEVTSESGTKKITYTIRYKVY